ncbi:mechanosensitive ion channel [Litoribacter alkaliphilus]|uniref:Mechanosensitive ion channel n=1 Tax=Litoribacter ruber TaxID=702568 RepID=A0AAP2G0W2_9BACT|nr:mechanosensitive ion channel domain-containing protein [Litoribacter alkaliphilus]MBS9523042.1 mechanosensitive ion channel [Litoribacter alkaliphilus]
METFLSDIRGQFGEYYDTLVAITPRLLIALVLLVVFWYISYYVKRLSTSRLQKNMNDSLLASFFARLIGSLIFILGLLFVLRFWGLTGMVGSILAGAGITAFVIGFALKDIGENFLAGILLAFKRPFRIGDTIEIVGVQGRVVALNLRDTQIKTFDGKDVYMPNGTIVKSPLTNFTIDGFLRHGFDIKIPAKSDYDALLKQIEIEVNRVEGVLKGRRKTSIQVKDISGGTVVITILFWVDTFTKRVPATHVKNKVMLTIQKLVDSW